jgi:hypothetical protein
MVRSRVFGILAGYEDQNDHDTLRTDPVFKLIANRSPTDTDLASQPTLSRFENQIDIPSLFRLRDVLIDQFIASFAQPPITLTFDLDAVDDPTHGSQQLTLFHAFYEHDQYLPLVITCAENDALAVLSLRHGTATASLGADDDLEYLVTRIRAVWPNVRIRVRGDGGFGKPTVACRACLQASRLDEVRSERAPGRDLHLRTLHECGVAAGVRGTAGRSRSPSRAADAIPVFSSRES